MTVAALCLLLAACRDSSVEPPVSRASKPAVSTKLSAVSHSPLSQAERRTTSGEIALGNLDGTITVLEHSVAARPGAVPEMSDLAELLLTRAEYCGRLADYERAAQLAELVMRAAPDDGQSYLLRARLRSTFHRFDDALADLAEAEKRGVGGEAVDGPRAEILQELGRYDEALVLRQRITAAHPDLITMGAEASLRGRRGETDEAERLFVEAQYHYRDVSPFPFAWLYFQQGMMWERAGNLVRARELYAAACTRVPGYARATGHLAAIEAMEGRRPRAVELLRPVVETSDDPEYAGQLLVLLREAGLRTEADALRERSITRFDLLIEQHPEAFAAKAARFWLGPGGDAAKALRLARINLAARQTSDALELAVEAGLAAGTLTDTPRR